MSVLDYQDLSACAKKIRKPGYWKLCVEYTNGRPEQKTRWIADRSTLDCQYDRKAIDLACSAAQCGRMV